MPASAVRPPVLVDCCRKAGKCCSINCVKACSLGENEYQ